MMENFSYRKFRLVDRIVIDLKKFFLARGWYSFNSIWLTLLMWRHIPQNNVLTLRVGCFVQWEELMRESFWGWTIWGKKTKKILPERFIGRASRKNGSKSTQNCPSKTYCAKISPIGAKKSVFLEHFSRLFNIWGDFWDKNEFQKVNKNKWQKYENI